MNKYIWGEKNTIYLNMHIWHAEINNAHMTHFPKGHREIFGRRFELHSLTVDLRCKQTL